MADSTSTATDSSAAPQPPPPPSSLTNATLTVRIIKSFPYRTCKNLILHNLNLTTLTVGDLKHTSREKIKTTSGFKPYLNILDRLDTIKLYTKAQGTKTVNLIINMEGDDEGLIFSDDGRSLEGCGCEHETEVSFFNRADYEEYKKNPEDKW